MLRCCGKCVIWPEWFYSARTTNSSLRKRSLPHATSGHPKEDFRLLSYNARLCLRHLQHHNSRLNSSCGVYLSNSFRIFGYTVWAMSFAHMKSKCSYLLYSKFWTYWFHHLLLKIPLFYVNQNFLVSRDGRQQQGCLREGVPSTTEASYRGTNLANLVVRYAVSKKALASK